MTEKNHRKIWTKSEEAALKKYLNDGVEIGVIAVLLGRTPSSIRDRNKKKGYKTVGRIRSTAVSTQKFTRPKEIYMSFGKEKSLLTLGMFECHFPIENSVMYCGEKTNRPFGYCRQHERICKVQKT